MLACFTLAITGCGGNADKKIENVIGGLIDAENKNIEAKSGEDASGDINNEHQGGDEDVQLPNGSTEVPLNGDNKSEWPSEVPGYVPHIKGDISQVVIMHPEEDATSYTIAYENVNESGLDFYENELLSSGWDVYYKIDYGQAWTIQATYNDEAIIYSCMG